MMRNDVAATRGIGPGVKVRASNHCAGCPALKLEDWEFHQEDDDIDRGTDAKCTAANRPISSYYRTWDETPEWCPALQSDEGG